MQENTNIPTIFALSDGTGETVQNIVKAAMVQFENAEIFVKRFNLIRTREALEQILVEAQLQKVTVVATIVNHDLRVFMLSRSLQLGVNVVDVLFPILETLSTQLDLKPRAVPGLLRQMDKDYFKRVSAMEFTVRHDDGIALQDLQEADIVLTGVSRTSKTPLSVYLGLKGYKVANVPLVLGVEPAEELFKIDQNKIIALIIDSDRLAEIRAARLKALGTEIAGDYADSARIFQELEWARDLFKSNRKWPVLDVTGKALEETAVEIERIILSRFPQRFSTKD